MKLILYIILVMISFSPRIIYSQETLFPYYKANPFEARVGSFYQPSHDKLRLDIGNSIDLHQFHIDNDWKGSIGTDAFILTRLRSEGNFKFPVETADYFFGINACAIGTLGNLPAGFRLRLSHISTHLVDGSANASGVFVDRKPFVYSREFADASGYITFDKLRLYAGLTWVWSTHPRDIGRVIPQLGFDIRYPISPGYEIQSGYDIKLSEVRGITLPQQSLQAGIAYLNAQRKGTWIGLVGSFGRNLHGMYYTEQDHYLGFGFQVLY